MHIRLMKKIKTTIVVNGKKNKSTNNISFEFEYYLWESLTTPLIGEYLKQE